MPPYRPGESNFGDALIRHCPPRNKKHAENITVCLLRLNHLNGNWMQLFLGDKF